MALVERLEPDREAPPDFVPDEALFPDFAAPDLPDEDLLPDELLFAVRVLPGVSDAAPERDLAFFDVPEEAERLLVDLPAVPPPDLDEAPPFVDFDVVELLLADFEPADELFADLDPDEADLVDFDVVVAMFSSLARKSTSPI